MKRQNLGSLLWGLAIMMVLITLPIMQLDLVAQESTPETDQTETTSEDIAENVVDTTMEVADSAATTAEGFLNELIQRPTSTLMQALLIIGGIALLVAGWRIHAFVILIAGVLVGAAVAVSIIESSNIILTMGAILIGGLIGAILSSFFYFVALFLIGAYVGIALTSGLATSLSLTPVSPIVLLAGGLIIGLVMIGLSYEFIVLLSAFVGAQMIVLALGLDFVWAVALTIAGIAIQIGLVRYLRYPIRRRPERINVFRRI